jgi:hypothetical protein
MYCIVVKRGDFHSYDVLHNAFGQRTPVVWERRHTERRHQAVAREGDDRRSTQRRGPAPPSWVALGFVVVNR